MSTIKTQIANTLRIFGIIALVAAFAAAAFPTRSLAANNMGKLVVSVYKVSSNPMSAIAPQPLKDASINIIDANGHSVANATTGTGGARTIELAKGVYKVQVSAPGYTSATGSIAVDAGKATEIKFELRPTTRLPIGGK